MGWPGTSDSATEDRRKAYCSSNDGRTVENPHDRKVPTIWFCSRAGEAVSARGSGFDGLIRLGVPVSQAFEDPLTQDTLRRSLERSSEGRGRGLFWVSRSVEKNGCIRATSGNILPSWSFAWRNSWSFATECHSVIFNVFRSWKRSPYLLFQKIRCAKTRKIGLSRSQQAPPKTFGWSAHAHIVIDG